MERKNIGCVFKELKDNDDNIDGNYKNNLYF
jgi:hypothetical protein